MNARIYATHRARELIQEEAYANPQPQQSWTTPAAMGAAGLGAAGLGATAVSKGMQASHAARNAPVIAANAEKYARRVNRMYAAAGKGAEKGYKTFTPQAASELMAKRGFQGTSKITGMTTGGAGRALGKFGKYGLIGAGALGVAAGGKKLLDRRKAMRAQASSDYEAQQQELANRPPSIRQTQQEDPDVQDAY